MTAFLYLVIYASALVFAGASALRVITYARAPIHLRWELYPMPHKPLRRNKQGNASSHGTGGILPSESARFLRELRFMLPEMLFLRGLWRHNRSLWYCSFPFHFGLYQLVAMVVLLAAAAALSLVEPALISGRLESAVRLLCGIAGAAGMVMSICGACALLARRTADAALRTYTTPGDFFNLAFFIVALGFLAVGYLSRGPSAPDFLAFSQGLLAFDTRLRIPWALSTGILLSALLVVYVPFTHMAHFIAKYFTYHQVLWDDHANRSGSELEVKLAEYLTYRPTWAAAHIGADGAKTWTHIVAANPASKDKP